MSALPIPFAIASNPEQAFQGAIAAARIAGKSDDQIRELVKVLHAKRFELTTLQGAAE